MKILIVIFLILMLLPVYAYAKEPTLPEGWRYPTAEESVDKSRPEGKAPYLKVNEDFNGDGVTDEAAILVNKDNEHMFGLFVFLSKKRKIITIHLDTSADKTFLSYMGIYPVKPGTYETACASRFYLCGKKKLRKIVLTLPAIDYFVSEGANAFYYWNIKEKKFSREWIGDE
jgi:hypothetical protein